MKFAPNITFLRYFYSAGQANSISKAAKEHFVSQSAISQAITKLELSLGKQLISHEQNRFQLTPDGILLLEKCKEIFDVFNEIEDVFNESEGVYKGRLSFACTHSFALTLLPPHLDSLSRKYPEIEPVLRFGHTGQIVELVKRGDVDFGIVIDNEDFSAFETKEIYRGEYRLYQSKSLTCVPKKFLISEERKEIAMLRECLTNKKISLTPFMEVSSWEVIAGFTEQGLGIGFFPDYITGKRALIPYKIQLPSIPYRLLAISPKNRALSRNAEMFINIMSHERLSED
jgi:DNA-binding transcriptional LysR family regulator